MRSVVLNSECTCGPPYKTTQTEREQLDTKPTKVAVPYRQTNTALSTTIKEPGREGRGTAKKKNELKLCCMH